jgi:hypothetical protein
MEIDAPFNLSMFENDDGSGYEIHLSFSPEFQGLDIATQGARVGAYVADLRQQAGSVAAGSREQQGMLTILQIAEQLLPPIRNGELELDQTIVIEITPPGGSDDRPIWQQLST